jgi:Zn-dependent peptidase ImmA (M78 family)/transcriptional regulator with XRE-family HTH domain
MTTAYIKPQMLAWAIQRCGVSPDELATKAMTSDSIRAWMSGDRLPTEAQAELLAEKLRVPYLLLFLDSPPEIDRLTIPDLRTVGGRSMVNPSVDFVAMFNDVLLRQDWFKEHQLASGSEKLDYVGRFSINDPPQTVARDMRDVLGFDNAFRDQVSEWEDLVKQLSRRAESVGILVMRSGFVAHAMNRPLDVEEFRGFALSDPIAPVIFINSQDALAAQNFTFAHELSHIWIGESGISNVRMTSVQQLNRVEHFCNQVAAEFLVPVHEFRTKWDEDESIWTNVRRISNAFKVSSLVVLLRALETDLIQYSAFKSAYEEEEQAIRDREKRESQSQPNAAQGGHFWNTFPWRVSHRFAETLVRDVQRDRTTYSEAAKLLGITVSSFENYYHQESGG